MASRAREGMKVVWTERAWKRLTEIEAFVARDHPEAAAKLVDKLIARGDRNPRNEKRQRVDKTLTRRPFFSPLKSRARKGVRVRIPAPAPMVRKSPGRDPGSP